MRVAACEAAGPGGGGQDKILMGSERRSLVMTQQCRRNTAYHEAGHALVALKTKGAAPPPAPSPAPGLASALQLPAPSFACSCRVLVQ